MNNSLSKIGLSMLSVLMVSCSSTSELQSDSPFPLAVDTANSLFIERDAVLIRAVYDATDFLVKKQNTPPYLVPRSGRGVLVATMVDINDLERASPLGRLVSEQVSSRLAQHGIAVNELKLRGNLYIDKSQGEFLLSREIKNISEVQGADYVITGTYAESNDSVYFTLKLIRANDSRVSNAFNFKIQKNTSISGLLRSPGKVQ